MMDTDAIYSAVCSYGTAKHRCWESDAEDTLSDIKRLLNEADEEHKSMLAENERLVDEVGGLKAARIAYASEFPPIPDGDDAGLPAVDRIHENIWRLKAERDALKAKYENTLAECRDAYPVPEVGSELEALWGQAMSNPASVGAYVKACATSQQKEIDELRAELEHIKALPPVAWYAPALDGRSVSYFDGKPMIMVGPTGNAIHTAPLYALGSKT